MQRRKILIIDDNAESRLIMNRALSSRGYIAAQAASGREAFRLLGTGELAIHCTHLTIAAKVSGALHCRVLDCQKESIDRYLASSLRA